MQIPIEWLAAPVAGGAVAGIGWLLKRLYSNVSHRINDAQNSANVAARLASDVEQRRREDVTDIHKKLDGHIQRDVEMHERVLVAMHEQTSKLGDIHSALVRDLGERPTRAEVKDMIELHQGRA